MVVRLADEPLCSDGLANAPTSRCPLESTVSAGHWCSHSTPLPRALRIAKIYVDFGRQRKAAMIRKFRTGRWLIAFRIWLTRSMVRSPLRFPIPTDLDILAGLVLGIVPIAGGCALAAPASAAAGCEPETFSPTQRTREPEQRTLAVP